MAFESPGYVMHLLYFFCDYSRFEDTESDDILENDNNDNPGNVELGNVIGFGMGDVPLELDVVYCTHCFTTDTLGL